MKKTMKVMSIVLMAALVLVMIGTNVKAFGADPGNIINEMQNHGNVDTSEISSFGGSLATIISSVGIVVAVIVLLILGIKYMMGSASEKAEYKKTMIPYLVGAVLILFASTIVTAIFGMFGQG